MKFIPTRIHGYLDYLVGLVMIAAPWLFGFSRGGSETWIFVVLGVAAVVYSLFTRYELGLVKTISMGTHLGLDVASGVLLLASPWLFGFAPWVAAPHVIFGFIEIGAAFFTRTEPEFSTHMTSHG
jgi:hypothetical protein